MPKMTIKAYETVIKCDWLGEDAQVLIGVEEEGHPEDACWESAVDEKIYFYISKEEMANLKIGDVLNDGEDFKIISHFLFTAADFRNNQGDSCYDTQQ